jgi:hypothetical protein
MSAWLEDEEDASQVVRALPTAASSNKAKAIAQVSRPVLPPRSRPLPPRAAHVDLIASKLAAVSDVPSVSLSSGASSLGHDTLVGRRRSDDDFDMMEDSDDDTCSERGRSSSIKKQQPSMAAACTDVNARPPLPPRVS